MSMPRDPSFYTSDPAHNLIPGVGDAVWYPLHDSSLLAGIDLLPALTEIVVSGSVSGAKWGTAGVYTFPTNNGGTDKVLLRATDDIDDLYLDSVMSFVGAAAGEHRIICCEASYDTAPSTSATLWGYGRGTATYSYYGFMLNAAEVPRIEIYPRGASGSQQTSLTAQSGTFASLHGNGVFACVIGFRLITATTMAVELRAGNGTQSCYYASSADLNLLVNSGTHPPGHTDGQSMATFLGLSLGARHSGAGTGDLFWGSGAASTGKVGNFSARRFPSYSSSRVADALTFMLNRKRDFPRSLCSDYQ